MERWTDILLSFSLGTYTDLGNREEAENMDFGKREAFGVQETTRTLSSLWG